jgi:hypothetical protein
VIKVFSTHDPIELNLVRSLLEASDIVAHTRGEATRTTGGPHAYVDPLSIWVAQDADAENAHRIVRDYLAEPDTSRGRIRGWQCSNCRETMDAQFTHCWNCGAEKAG